MTREEKIREAIQQAKEKGIEIVRAPLFDWTKPNPDGGWPISSGTLPSACDILGAMMLYSGPVAPSQYNWDLLGKKFNVNGFWLYRFHIGSSVGNQIFIEKENKTTKKKYKTPDKVCQLGLKLGKEYVR